MRENAETLRQRIALYRRYLAEGVDAEFAKIYTQEIAHAEASLRDLVRPGNAEPAT